MCHLLVRIVTASVMLCLVAAAVVSQEKVRVTETAFTVPPGAFAYYGFRIPEGARNAEVWGRFRASGGSKNDIRTMLMDDDSFENYSNGNRFFTYYDSGYVTVATLRVGTLRPGHYFLVFDNKGAIISNKAVRSDIFAQWWRRR